MLDGRIHPHRIEEVYDGAKNEVDLPAKARRYLERLEELIGVPFCVISTGAQRDETIRPGTSMEASAGGWGSVSWVTAWPASFRASSPFPFAFFWYAFQCWN